MPVTAGDHFGPYEVIALIGTGGMGEIYRARDTRLNRDVAIKILPPDFADNAVRRARFEREAQAISRLNHPNICALYDVGRTTASRTSSWSTSKASRWPSACAGVRFRRLQRTYENIIKLSRHPAGRRSTTRNDHSIREH